MTDQPIDTMEVGEAPLASPDYSQRIVEADQAAPDFSSEWAQIRQDLLDEADAQLAQAERWLRVGQSLIKIRDVLKPRGTWLAELERNGIAQSTAWRKIEYAELSENDREIYL